MAGDRIAITANDPNLLSAGGISNSAPAMPDIIYEALVVDVIVDHKHPLYAKDGLNVGAIKVRILSVNHSLDSKLLPWAEPFDTTVYQLPLLGELVTLQKVRGNFFYSRKLPIAHRVQENSMLLMEMVLNLKAVNTLSAKLKELTEIEPEKHKFGQYFKPDSRVRAIKHFEGDTIIQGRMGHSIRLGSSKIDPTSKSLAPNIILRTGQGKDLEKGATVDGIYGLILEDINKDASSIWMTSDQGVPLEVSTINAGSYYRSLLSPPQLWTGAQIIQNSDRIILNSKNSHIMLFSNDEIYLNGFNGIGIDSDGKISATANLDISHRAGRNIDNIADEDFTIKTGGDISLMALGKLSFTGSKIHFGGIENGVEPMVGGTSLAMFLARLIQVLMGTGAVTPQVPYQLQGLPAPPPVAPPAIAPGPATFQHIITPMGFGMLSPLVTAGLMQLYAELVSPNVGTKTPLPFSGAVFNSSDAYVGMSNENAVLGIEKNEFESGTQLKVETNEWKTSEDYYKVL